MNTFISKHSHRYVFITAKWQIMFCMILLLLVSGIQKATAQNITQLNLKKCLEMALNNDQRMKLATMEQTKARYQRNQTVGAGLPQVSASGTFQNYLKLPTQLIPGEFFGSPGELIPIQFGTNYNMSGGIQVSQLVYNQSYLVSMQLSRKMMEQKNLDLEKTSQDVIYDVAQLYYYTMLTNLQIEYMKGNLQKIDTLAALTKVHYDNGFIKKVDLDRINVSEINLQTEISNLRMMYNQQLNMIKYFIGLNSADSVVLTGSILDINLSVSENQNVENHITLRILDNQKQLMHDQLRMAKSQYYPSLSFFGDFSYNNQQNDAEKLFKGKDNWLGTSVVGLSLNVPVFSGFQRYFNVKQAKIQYDELSVTRDYSKKLIETQIQNANDKLTNSRKVAASQQMNVKLAAEVYSVVNVQFAQGIIPLTDVLSAETSLITAQSTYVQALVQMKLAELDLNKSTGNLTNAFKN